MTLNITAMSDNYVVQVSDRRLSRDGKPVDDRANKAVVVQCEDGVLSVTFSGVASVGTQRTDIWLAQKLLEEGGPDQPIERTVETICREATSWFQNMARTVPSRYRFHTFVAAGWETNGGPPRPTLWLISNCAGPRGEQLAQPAQSFTASRQRGVKGGGVYLLATALHRSLPRSEKRRLRSTLARLYDVPEIERRIVAAVQAAAADDELIGSHCMAVTLAPDGRVWATYHSPSSTIVNHMPIFVWHENGHNILAGDAKVEPAGAYCTFGEGRFKLQLAGPVRTGPPPSKGEVSMLNRVTRSKLKPGDGEPLSHRLVEFNPLRS